jgi:hypothetical protein
MTKLFLLTVVSIIPTAAIAFELDETSSGTPRTWPGGAVAMTVNTTHFPTDSAMYDSVTRAIEAWDTTNIGGTSFGTTYGERPSTGFKHSNNDNVNSVGYTLDLGPCTGANAAAAADMRYQRPFHPSRIREADILINARCTWFDHDDYFDVNDADTTQSRFDIEVTVLHEMGHVVGLDHTEGDWDTNFEYVDGAYIITLAEGNSWAMNMHESYDGHGASIGDPGFLERAYDVNEDERQGLRHLYPDNSIRTDFAVQSYFEPASDSIAADFSPCGGEFRYKARPSPYRDLTDCPADRSTEPMEDLRILNGGSISTTFSLLALGTEEAPPSMVVTYTLRTDPLSTTGIVLATDTVPIVPNTPNEYSRTIRVPNDIPRGTWYLTVDVDSNNTSDEAIETNNRAVWNRRIRTGLYEIRSTPVNFDLMRTRLDRRW